MPKLDETLDPKQIAMLIDYVKKLNKHFDDNLNKLAAKMGIDPEKDILVVPQSMVGKKFRPPMWIHYMRDVEAPYVLRGIRDMKAGTIVELKKGQNNE